jgi:hypothetical protein
MLGAEKRVPCQGRRRRAPWGSVLEEFLECGEEVLAAFWGEGEGEVVAGLVGEGEAVEEGVAGVEEGGEFLWGEVWEVGHEGLRWSGGWEGAWRGHRGGEEWRGSGP